MYVVKIIDDLDKYTIKSFYFNSKDSADEIEKYLNSTLDKELMNVERSEVHPMDVESAKNFIDIFNSEIAKAVSFEDIF